MWNLRTDRVPVRYMDITEFAIETWRTLLIKSNQVLRISEAKDLVQDLYFKTREKRNSNLTLDWVKWLWTLPRDKLNATVIEFSLIALKILSRSYYLCLISAMPEKNTKVTLDYYNGLIISLTIQVNGDSICFKLEEENMNAGDEK